MSFFRDAMKIPEQAPLPDEEQAVLDKVAKKVVEKSMTVPAIVFLESIKPLNFVGSQAMVFFEPIVQSLFNLKDYDTFRTALEKRQTLEILIQKIEAMDAVAQARDKRIKAFFKEEKKKWKWYQRYLGVFQPRVTIPDEVLNGPVAAKRDSESK